MRKSIFLFVAFCLSLSYVKGQQSIVFKIKYLPGHKYESNVSMTSNIEMNIENLTKKDSDKLIEKGMTMPLMASISTLGDMTILTGKLSSENTFPIIFKFNDVKKTGTLNGKEMEGGSTAIAGHVIYATSTLSNDMHIDSMPGKPLDTALSKELKGMFDGVVTELHLPEKTIKVGDTFTQEIPLHMPMNGADIAITIKATYKLISIKKGLANFDIVQVSQLDFNNNEPSQGLTGKGSGHGKMTYDIKRNFPKSINRDLSFEYEMKYKGLTMNGKARIVSFYLFSTADNPTN